MGWLSDFADDVLGFDPNGGGINDVVDDIVGFYLGGAIIKEGLQWLLGVQAPEMPDQFQDRSLLVNRASNVAKIPVVYGTRRVGGTRVFQSVSGANNEYLWLVIALSEGEIAGVDTVYLDDLPSTDTKFGSTVQITQYVGANTQSADAGLMAAFTGQWTANHRLLGTAYLVVRLTFDANVYDRVPTITADVRGRKVYDPRDGLTKFTSNPALCIYDYLINARYGKGLAAALLDTSAFIIAANYCETQIAAYSGGPNINIFECNGVVDTGQDGKRNVEELLTSCRGYLPYTGGQYKLVIDKDEAPALTFTENNIIGAWSIQGASKRTRLNRAKAKFTNPAKSWQPDLAITDSATLRTQDAGLLLEKELQFPFETSYYRAVYHTEVAMKRSRQGLTCGFVAAPEALKVEIGDIVAITHATPGWTAKKFRATGLTLRTDGLVSVTCTEHETTAYDRTVPVEAATSSDTNLPDPRNVPAPTALILLSDTSQAIPAPGGGMIPRIKATWTASASSYVIGYEVYAKRSADIDWILVATTSARNDVTAYISPVEDGAAYDVRVRALNSMGFYSSYLYSANYAVLGDNAGPSAPSSLTTQSRIFGIAITVGIPSASDLRYTEIWYGPSNNRASATLLTALPYPQSTHMQNGLAAAATFYYWARGVDSSGNIGEWYPASETAGVIGQSSSSASEILSYLSQQIQETHLYSALLGKVNDGDTAANEWAVKVQARASDGKKYIAGLGVSVENGASGAMQSELILAANRVSVIDPAGAGQVAPFIIQGGQVFINQAIIGNAWITNAMIANVIQSNDGGATWSINKAGGIDARNITIRDSSGSVLLQSGGNLSLNRVSGAGALAGLSQLTLGTYIANGIIDNAHLGNASVDTLKLAGQAVTIPTSGYTDGSVVTTNASPPVQSLSYSSSGAPVVLFFSALGNVSLVGVFTPSFVNVQIIRNGALVYSVKGPLGSLVSGSFMDTPGPVAVTYQMKMFFDNGMALTVSKRSLISIEVKR